MTPFEQYLKRLPQKEANDVRRAVEQGDWDWLRDYARRKYEGHVEHRSSINPAPARSGKPDTRYSWMGPRLERFFRLQEREQQFDKLLASVDPDTNLGRWLKLERVVAEIELDRLRDENRRMKFELDERWRLKDECAVFPVWRDVGLYRTKPTERRREKDPWAAYRLF